MNEPRRKRPAARRQKQPPPMRTFTLGAVFAPDGHTPGTDQTERFASRVTGMKAFLEFWTEARDEILCRRKRAFQIRRARISKLLKTGQTPCKHQEPPHPSAEIARQEAELAQTQRLASATLAINDGLSTLSDAAQAGDLAATKHLAEAAILAATFLFQIEKMRPDLARVAARGQALWPVLAKDKPTWAAEAARRVAALDLGASLEPLRVRFRKPRGHDDTWPARQWAKGAVRTIEETRLRIMQFGEVLRGFGSNEALADWCMSAGWDGPHEQPWVRTVAQLPPLTMKCLPQWKAAIRELIRSQHPDFHLHSAWSNQRHGARLNGRDTKGAIQGRILDDICDALETLVPPPPESTSRNPGAETPGPDPGSGKPASEAGEARQPAPRLNGEDDNSNRKRSGNGK